MRRYSPMPVLCLAAGLLAVAATADAAKPKPTPRRSVAQPPSARMAVEKPLTRGPAPRVRSVRPLDPDGWPSLCMGQPFTITGEDLAGTDGSQVAIARLEAPPVSGSPYGEPAPDPAVEPAQVFAIFPADSASATRISATVPAAFGRGPGRYALHVTNATGGWSNLAVVDLTNGPAPVPGAIVDVGTFDAATGIFTGLLTEEISYCPAPGKPERTRPAHPSAFASLPPARLRFHFVNAVGGGAASATPSRGKEFPADGSIIVDVGAAPTVNWTVRAAGKTYSDELNLHYGSHAAPDTPLSRSLAAIDAFSASTVPGKFSSVDKAVLVKDLRERVQTPTIMNQSDQSLCGPMAVLVALARRSPERYVAMVRQLYENGAFAADADYTIRPSDHLYGAPVPAGMAPADWLAAASMRDFENAVMDFDAGDQMAGMTLPGEIETWFHHVLLCNTTNFTSCYAWGEQDALRGGLDAVQAGGVAALMVDSQYLPDGMPSTVNIADHWILLMNVDNASDPYSLDIFSWGSVWHVDIGQARFEDLLWGVVTGAF